MQPPPRLDLGNPPQPQQQSAQQQPPHFPPPPYREEQAPRPKSGVARLLPTFITLSAFAGLAVLAWFAYQEGKSPISEEEIPVIKAENEPFKRAPENPGGDEVPHADKEVYNSFNSDAPEVEAKKTETMPDAERPIDRSFLKQFAGTGEDDSANPVKQESVTFGEKPATPVVAAGEVPLEAKPLPLAQPHETLPTPNTGGVAVVKKMEEVKLPSQPVPFTSTEEPAKEVKKVEKAAVAVPVKKEVAKKPVVAKAKEKVTAVAKKPAVVTKASGIRVQLGAFRSDAEATREWKKIQAKNKSALSGLTMMVQKVEIPAKGTMFRLQAGPVKSKDEARIMCKKLVAAGQGCFVAK